MWLLVAPRAAKVLMVMRASGSSRLILASAPRNGAVRGSQPETTARKSGRRLTRRVRYGPSGGERGAPIEKLAHRKRGGAALPLPGHQPEDLQPTADLVGEVDRHAHKLSLCADEMAHGMGCEALHTRLPVPVRAHELGVSVSFASSLLRWSAVAARAWCASR